MRRRSSSSDTLKPKTDLFQRITDKIIVALEQGTLPWRKPWRIADLHDPGTFSLPSNAITDRTYSGINVVLLWIEANEKGFSSNRWLTFRQALEAGGNVRKGEKASLVMLYKPFEQQHTDEHGRPELDKNGDVLKSQRSFMTSFHLFNVEQCENLPAKVMSPMADRQTRGESITRICRADQIIASSGVSVIHRFQQRAFYNKASDTITLPDPSQFDSQADYYSTLLHELVHSTGHISRLAREGIISTSRKFGDPVEELIAEFGAAFLCAELGIEGNTQHENYIAGWLNVLKEDNRAIFRACRFAREAFEYLVQSFI